ncbi:Protein Dr1 [Fragariocoptes setiger]|uniref:Protein Dr1 n=1 Tax=Fragariocoptes setiger TaxID=1670756 RepID=A0ABQ7S5Q1_9ACAR|nr:Protein Dr1 [Fragariocoptes setiger]
MTIIMNNNEDSDDWKSKESNEDLNIPRASINKFMKEVIPDVRVSNETREVILQCCNEFIHIVTRQANSICDEQQKKTLSSEHVLSVFDQFGWSEYKAAAELVENDCKEKKRRQSTKLEHSGIPEEVLLKQQQELINQAKQEQARREQDEWSQIQQLANMQQT